MTFRPMLALSKLPDFALLRFPILISPKLDGIRATIQDGKVLSRSLKPIPNEFIQELFGALPPGLDGELIQGNPSDDPYRRTLSIVMSEKKPIDGVKLYLFDRFAPPTEQYVTRFHEAPWRHEYAALYPHIVYVPHFTISSVEELEQAEAFFLGRGYEGAILRSFSGPYKQGRSSEREGYLMKVKRFQDAEARIESCYEEMENQNVAFTNELGRTARSSHKAGKVGKNRLGGFHVVGVGGDYDGVKFDVPSGAMAHEMRETLWKCQPELIGRLVIFKYFPTGGKDSPRHPIFKGFRDERDL